MLLRLPALFEAERDRWILWLPIALAVGVGIYFTLAREPPPWLGMTSCGGAGLLLALWRGRAGWPLCFGLLLIALGFTAAQLRSQVVAAPVLQRPTGMIRVVGRVIATEPVAHGQRLVLDRLSGGSLRQDGLVRVRIRLRADYGVAPGQVVMLRASLMPPPPPMAPGGYDFARQAWFQRLGAVGYALGAPRVIASTRHNGWIDRGLLWLGRQRQALSGRIIGAIDGAGFAPGIGVVAAALITGQRGPVPPVILQSYRDAGLAHILVIAGMHLSMVAGLVLVGLRALLAAIPGIALRLPIHKISAALALLVTLGYLLISGAPVPTQRAFIMNGCLLLAMLLDRQPISLRSISLAATLVLLLQPEALIGASFQLSFAAVYGLIAGYEALGPRLAAWRQGGSGPARSLLLYLGGVLLTTQIAGTATAFYSLYHFNRYAVYALLGNFLAVPLVGFWVMPAALIGVSLLPLGLDGWGWQAMAAGLTLVTRIAVWVSHLPGATVCAPSMPPWSLLLFSLGAAWLLLWRQRWRLLGLPLMAAGLAGGLVAPPPDLLLDPRLRVAALREEDGHLHQTSGRGDRSLREAWARLAGEGERMAPISADSRVRCDDADCEVEVGAHRHHLPRPDASAGTVAVWWRDPDPPLILSVSGWQGDRPWRPVISAGGSPRPCSSDGCD